MIILTKESMDATDAQIVERCIKELELKIEDFASRDKLEEDDSYVMRIVDPNTGERYNIQHASWYRDYLDYWEIIINCNMAHDKEVFAIVAFAFYQYGEAMRKLISSRCARDNFVEKCPKKERKTAKEHQEYLSAFGDGSTWRRSQFWFVEPTEEDVMRLGKEDSIYTIFVEIMKKTVENYKLQIKKWN